MELSDCLTEAQIRVGSTAASKDAVLKEIAELVKRSSAAKAYTVDDIYQALREREDIGTTGFGQGIAIPHCGLEEMTDFVVGLLLVPGGVDFDSFDEKPAHTFAYIVGPKAERRDHVSLLSAISKVLNDEKAVKELSQHNDPRAVLESFLRFHSPQVPGKKEKQCLCHVFVQDQEKFEDILTIFSGAITGELMVMEADNAGNYLNRMPLFSAFWSDQSRGFGRIIVAVVDKKLVNDVIRRIHTEVQDLEERSGVLVTAQELLYAAGSLEF